MSWTLEDVVSIIEEEGFDYTLRSYADFSDVDDEDFRKLYIAYIEAANKLEHFLNNI